MGAGAGDAGRNSPASPERRRCAAAGAGAGADGWNSPASPEMAAGAGAAAAGAASACSPCGFHGGAIAPAGRCRICTWACRQIQSSPRLLPASKITPRRLLTRFASFLNPMTLW